MSNETSPFFTPKEGGVAEVVRPLDNGPYVVEVWRTPPEGSGIKAGQIRKVLSRTVNVAHLGRPVGAE